MTVKQKSFLGIIVLLLLGAVFFSGLLTIVKVNERIKIGENNWLVTRSSGPIYECGDCIKPEESNIVFRGNICSGIDVGVARDVLITDCGGRTLQQPLHFKYSYDKTTQTHLLPGPDIPEIALGRNGVLELQLSSFDWSNVKRAVINVGWGGRGCTDGGGDLLINGVNVNGLAGGGGGAVTLYRVTKDEKFTINPCTASVVGGVRNQCESGDWKFQKIGTPSSITAQASAGNRCDQFILMIPKNPIMEVSYFEMPMVEQPKVVEEESKTASTAAGESVGKLLEQTGLEKSTVAQLLQEGTNYRKTLRWVLILSVIALAIVWIRTRKG